VKPPEIFVSFPDLFERPGLENSEKKNRVYGSEIKHCSNTQDVQRIA
jgi:hypothetical protein